MLDSLSELELTTVEAALLCELREERELTLAPLEECALAELGVLEDKLAVASLL